MKLNHITLFITLLLVGTLACEEPDCVSELSSTINISLYKLEKNELDTVFLNELKAIGIDTALLSDVPDVSGFALPADPNANEVTFVFDTREYGIDTLTLAYSTGGRFISEDCGVELLYSDLKAVRSDFDSISVINTILADVVNEDIRVYNND
ncbi:hypothetical protein E1176_17790 [Fulvivirga sp. RKSG066]|uniref:DUF6452 family protein n=1 Tax=Fulvivirga aurantia TaxID=2529383 RepID=UPI0012BC81F0|nr:DUF6452 family protein [Fulvivirga aurantia]MTI22889.1 hypothetical protein [Fulvivirga aurantia]